MKHKSNWNKELIRIKGIIKSKCDINETVKIYGKFINDNKYYDFNNDSEETKELTNELFKRLDENNLGNTLIINSLQDNKIINPILLLYFFKELYKNNNYEMSVSLKKGDYAAATNNDTEDIYYDYNSIMKQYKDIFKEYGKNQGIDMMNIMILFTACHEMSHLIHLKTIREGKDNYSASIELEYELLKMFEGLNRQVYLDKHDSFHLEHLATIDGFEMLKTMINTTFKNDKTYIFNGMIEMLVDSENNKYYQIVDGIKTLDPRGVIANHLLKSIEDKDLKKMLINLFLDNRKYYNDVKNTEFITNKSFTEDELKQLFFNIYGYYLLTNKYVDASHQYIVNDIKKYSLDKLLYKYKSLSYKKMLQRLFLRVGTFSRIEKLELIRSFDNDKEILLPLLIKEELTTKNNGCENNLEDIKTITKETNYLINNNVLFYSPIFSQVAELINDFHVIDLDELARLFTSEKYNQLKKDFKGSDYSFSLEYSNKLKELLLQYDEYIKDLETNIQLERKKYNG